MKLKEDCYVILKTELENSEGGPFSKFLNVMFALDQMAKGEFFNQVTKVHLINIIKVLNTKLEWTEESNEVIHNVEKNDSSKEKHEGNQSSHTNSQSVTKNSQQVCKFYKAGNYQHGRSRKKVDKSGKNCAYSHPPVCKKFEMYGNKEEGC